MSATSCKNHTVFAEVVAVPVASASSLRVGARFQLSEQTPLTIGRSTRCRLQVDVPAGQDVLVGVKWAGAKAWVERGTPIPCSVSGRTLDGAFPWDLDDGDHLVFPGGLVLVIREQPSAVARHPGLEQTLATTPDDREALAVYVDFLKEQGDPLARWLEHGRVDVEAQRFAALGPLSESARTQAVQATFSASGLVTSLRLARHAIVGAPGLFWHLEQLANVGALRALRSLTIDYVVGTPARRLEAPRGRVDWPREPGLADVVPEVVELLGGVKTLRHVSLGLAAKDLEAPLGVEARLRALLPSWDGAPLIDFPRSATLELVSCPAGVTVVPHLVGDLFRLSPQTSVGSGARCQLLVRGPRSAESLCRFVRRDEGWRVQASEQQTLRVNGQVVEQAALRTGDEVELLPGLVFRFRVTLPDQRLAD
jgi:uncharacterized protein (TIGR02996 family)